MLFPRSRPVAGMDMTPDNVNDMASAIELALAPAFLLTGIAGMLNVMAGRLSRIMDRGRVLLAQDQGGEGSSGQAALTIELQGLERRRHFTSVAITACTISALLVCLVIAILFVEVLLHAPLKWFIGALFTAATLSLVIGLAFFLREVHLATKTIRITRPGAR